MKIDSVCVCGSLRYEINFMRRSEHTILLFKLLFQMRAGTTAFPF